MEKRNSYQIVQHAEVLILLKKFDEANELLNRVDENDRVPFWWQRKAQILNGLEQANFALDAINKGLDGLKDNKYKPAFLNDRYQIRKKLSDPEAKEDLNTAISMLSVEDKFRKALELELSICGHN
jgi:hypothetical protein